ncbi:D-2-hydroxyacid dehydrogenase [Pseudochelatococcus sp. B33]
MVSQVLKIVFLDRDTLPPSVVLRSPAFPHELVSYGSTAADQIQARISDADILITNKVPIRDRHLRAAPRLRLIAVAATGTDIIDIDECRRRGVSVTNIRGYAIDTVPEHTFALILGLRRSIIAYHKSIARGDWARSGQFCYFDYPIGDLSGATIGIVGDGVLGQAVGAIARAFKMNVLFASYKGVEGMGPLYTPFDRVMAESDIITLHAPLTETTRNLISDREFDLMARKPIIINTARGGLVDEEALCRALDAGKIAGAGFDVLTEEPPSDDHPMLRLVDRPDVILTPHVAWASRAATQALADQLIENIEAFVRGEPTRIVS